MMSSSNRSITFHDYSVITEIAILAAFSLFLSTVEYMIPKPMPFLRIGLANLPIMISLAILTFPEFLLLVLLKIIGQGLVNGTLFSYIFIYSAGGSVSSSIVMYLLFKGRGRYLSYVGISIIGAMTSNLVQMLLADLLLFGTGIWIIAPPFLVMGFISSIMLGLFTNYFTDHSRWFSHACRRRALLKGAGV